MPIVDMETPHRPEDMSDKLKAKVRESVRFFKTFTPPPPDKYWLAFSGGKDSIVLKKIADLAEVDYEAHYSVTSVDPPELMKYIRQYHPDVTWDYPRDRNGKRVSMWTLIAQHTLPPTRMVRYCCSALKESNVAARVTVTGVRWAESANRKNNHGVVDFQNKPVSTRKVAERLNVEYGTNKSGGVILNNDNDESRRMVEQCYRTRKTLLNPIIKWTERDVWDFIFAYGLPYCELYDEGFTRLGCIGCPLSGRKNMERDFERWPRYKELYIRAFEKMIENHPGQIKILQPEYAAAYPLEAEDNERFVSNQLLVNGGGYRKTCRREMDGMVQGDLKNTNGNGASTCPCGCSSTGSKSENSSNSHAGGDVYSPSSCGTRIIAELCFRRWLRVVY